MPMTRTDLKELLEFSRRKTLELLDNIAGRPEAAAILAWRPGPGRAHIGWQLMHIAATDDRHVHVRMMGGQPTEPELVQRFAGGSTPDDDVPSVDVIRQYLADRRRDLLELLQGLPESALPTRPNEQAPWTYHEWFKVLAWHEAHHEGQAHLTLNLYRIAHDPALPKLGH
jgi:predicted CopG family antitoxin